MKVKICGLQTLDDVLMSVELGADMVGFNFYRDSERCVDPSTCAHFVAELRLRNPQTVTVGIFVNRAAGEIRALMDECGLDLAQLHGDESLATLRELEGRAFKAIRASDRAEAVAQAARFSQAKSPIGPSLLLDAHLPGKYGGTGRLADWVLAAALAADRPLLLAGGLSPENVDGAVRRVRPWGVDVASGVERAPGIKDHEKTAAFIQAARSAYMEVVQ